MIRSKKFYATGSIVSISIMFLSLMLGFVEDGRTATTVIGIVIVVPIIRPLLMKEVRVIGYCSSWHRYISL